MIDWREMPDLLSGESRLALTNHKLLEVFLREVMGFEGIAISPDLVAAGAGAPAGGRKPGGDDQRRGGRAGRACPIRRL